MNGNGTESTSTKIQKHYIIFKIWEQGWGFNNHDDSDLMEALQLISESHPDHSDNSNILTYSQMSF